MTQKIHQKLLELAFAFFSMAVILGAIAYSEPEKLEPINQIFAEYSPVQPGVPDKIVGVWRGTNLSMYLKEDQIIMHTIGRSSIQLKPTTTLVQNEFDLPNVKDTKDRTLYIIYSDNLESKDGNEDPLYLIFDASSRTLTLEDGRVLRR